MEVRSKFHAPADISREKHLLTVGKEDGRAREPVWTLWS
jgi:hypothetical protein